jgi:hypothetical protein
LSPAPAGYPYRNDDYKTSDVFVYNDVIWYSYSFPDPFRLWGLNPNNGTTNLSDQTITWGKGLIEQENNFRVPSQYEWALLVSNNTNGINGANKVDDAIDDNHTPSTDGVIPAGNPNVLWFPVVNGKISTSFGSGNMCGYAIYLATDKAAVVSASDNGHLYDAGAPEPLLFLPAVGFRDYNDGMLGYAGNGYYWSSTAGGPYPPVINDARRLYFRDDYMSASSYEYRSCGQSVRCLSE